ncbi:hypothetical protein M0R04_06770 [Candidatus Dojkabacteria bacterium]|jgi:hypothetical protein|nr:hypothetical protein [Candidatus Dojkabacteria bacterium]
METTSLQDIIRQHINLDRPNSQGWCPVLCRVCGDKGHKGKRAAFRFDDHTVGYNCFNCSTTAVYDPSQNRNPSKSMIQVLESFGIPEVEWRKISFDALVNKYDTVDHERQQIEPTEIPLLPFFYPLSDDKDDDWCQYSIDYLTERGIDWKSYPFFCVRRNEHPDNKRWYGRLIIPTYKDKKLIFYQGRDLTDLHKKKYLSATTIRENVMYGYNQLLVYSQDPLYVTEGFFDSFMLNGVAIFCNKLTAQQILWLNRSNRPKVIIPDRYGDGQILANQAIELGWKISTLDLGDNCKDVNESIVKHGMLYTIKTIVNNTTEGVQASVRVNAYCKRGKYV